MALPAALLSSIALAQDQQSQSQQNDEVHQNTTARQPMSPLNSDMSAATYSHLDKNRDGVVSPEEAAADPSFHSRPPATGGTSHHKQQATAEGQVTPTDESTQQDQGMKDDSTRNDDTTTDAPPTPPR
jgi:hypothetical protein